MIRCDALIVGGGPAGSTCARALVRAGWNVAVADRARFPRDKVCAGWLTPEVFPLVDLTPEEYGRDGRTLQEIRAFRTGIIGGRLLETRYPQVVSFAVRRCEFDTFLLRRTGAHVLENTMVTAIRRERDRWIVNEAIETPIVIGAGGHFCPIARFLRGGADDERPVVAKEAEFAFEGTDESGGDGAPELFFCRDLEGYGWCVRKGSYLNVGIGRRDSRHFNEHVRDFVRFLEESGALPRGADIRWHGHAYLASGAGVRPIAGPGLLLVGDAAGLAYPESGEGIRPAVESARIAADALIAAGGRTDEAALRPYVEALCRRHPQTAPASPAVRPFTTRLGRVLLGSRAFTRHIVLDRWFLRTHLPALAHERVAVAD